MLSGYLFGFDAPRPQTGKGDEQNAEKFGCQRGRKQPAGSLEIGKDLIVRRDTPSQTGYSVVTEPIQMNNQQNNADCPH